MSTSKDHQRSRTAKQAIGGAAWLAIATLLIASLGFSGNSPLKIGQLTSFAVSGERIVEVDHGGAQLRSGDPVFAHQTDEQWHQIGHVGSVSPESTELIMYGESANSSYQFTYCENRGSLAEAAQLLLPPQRREAIIARLTEMQRAHGDEITAAFRPVIEKSLLESVPVIQAGLTSAVELHRDEIAALGKDYEARVLNDRLIPLVHSEILPIVNTHGEPLAKEIGLELWDRASLFRFGWRLVYDKSPLPSKNLTGKEWDRFVEQEAMPVFQSRVDQMVDAVKQILIDISLNKVVRDEMLALSQEVIADKRLQSLITEIVQDGIIKNEALREVWYRNWQSAEAQSAMRLAEQRLEPIVRQIGDEILGSEETGISPGFARVLRNQILGKDRRWIEAVRIGSSEELAEVPRLQISPDTRPYPMLFLAGQLQD